MKTISLLLILLLAAAPTFATESPDGAESDAPTVAEPVVREPQDLQIKFTGEPAATIHLIGADIEPGTRRSLRWFSPQSPGGFAVATPVIVVNGRQTGPVLCLTAAIHGDELNGVEIVRRIVHGLDPI